MTKSMLTRWAAVLALALAACGDDGDSGPTGPQPIPSGSFSFSLPAYGGQAASAFSARGAAGRDSLAYFTLGNWAFAEPGAQARAPLYVYASAPAGTGDLYHYVSLQVPRDVQAGAVVPLRANCPSTAIDCGEISVLMNMVNTRPPGENSITAGCLPAMAGGSVRIAARTATRVTGTFTLHAYCAVLSTQDAFEHTAADGSFDVPIVQPDDYPPIPG